MRSSSAFLTASAASAASAAFRAASAFILASCLRFSRSSSSASFRMRSSSAFRAASAASFDMVRTFFTFTFTVTGATFASTFGMEMGPVVTLSTFGTLLTAATTFSARDGAALSLECSDAALISSPGGGTMVLCTLTEPEERARLTCDGRMPSPASSAMASFTFASNAARMALSETRAL